MVSEDKISAFLRLQQTALDIKDSVRLLEILLPKILSELNSLRYPYVFLSAIFIDQDGKIKQIFFTDKNNQLIPEGVTTGENLFKKGSEWEMKVLYGEAAVVSKVEDLVNPSYPKFSLLHSLLILPIKCIRQITGVLILGSSNMPDKIGSEEIELGLMITKLVDFSFRLQDTETSLTKITQEVYGMNAKLHQIDKLKDDFVSIASHELRTPMTAIRSYAWMALHRADTPLTPKMEKYLIRVLLSTERLINLVNDMLNISRIESGKIEIKPESVDLISLCKDIIDEVYYSKGVEKKINFNLLEHPTPKVFADPDKLRQVFMNLVGNSLKFTPNGGSITFKFFCDGKTVETSIIDTGAGISGEDISRLFQKFGRLDNSYVAAATSGGTGLGLFISKKLIELMHGRIWANSQGLGKGATFTLSLPVASTEVLQHANLYTIKPAGEVKELEPMAI